MKEHSTIDCLKEFDRDVLKTFFALQVLALNILQRMWELINTLTSQKLCSLLKPISCTATLAIQQLYP